MIEMKFLFLKNPLDFLTSNCTYFKKYFVVSLFHNNFQILLLLLQLLPLPFSFVTVICKDQYKIPRCSSTGSFVKDETNYIYFILMQFIFIIFYPDFSAILKWNIFFCLKTFIISPVYLYFKLVCFAVTIPFIFKLNIFFFFFFIIFFPLFLPFYDCWCCLPFCVCCFFYVAILYNFYVIS